MNNSFMKFVFVAIACLTCECVANAQLPNEKFGKPSSLEWEYVGWGDALDADAIVLCKTMTATYQLSDQVANNNRTDIEVGWDNIDDFGKNQIDDSNILVKYDIRLRTKILKPEGAKHANIDITYFSPENKNYFDELSDLKVRVFTKNAKGKVEKTNVNTSSFVSERVDANYMVIHVVVPKATAGSIIEYQYSITSPRPAFLYDWAFQECIPTVHTKCDIEIPAFLLFKMNVPINKIIKPNVEVGHLAYDTNRTDMKKAKTCVTNHYTIVGDHILPKGQVLKNKQDGADKTAEEIANFTSQITKPAVNNQALMPAGSTHLRIK